MAELEVADAALLNPREVMSGLLFHFLKSALFSLKSNVHNASLAIELDAFLQRYNEFFIHAGDKGGGLPFRVRTELFCKGMTNAFGVQGTL